MLENKSWHLTWGGPTNSMETCNMIGIYNMNLLLNLLLTTYDLLLTNSYVCWYVNNCKRLDYILKHLQKILRKCYSNLRGQFIWGNWRSLPGNWTWGSWLGHCGIMDINNPHSLHWTVFLSNTNKILWCDCSAHKIGDCRHTTDLN